MSESLGNKRNTSGLSKPGQTNNPNGRPQIPEELKKRLKELTPKAIEVMAEIMLDTEQRGSDRLKAAELIADRAYGKPVQQVDAEVDATIGIISIGVPDFVK